MEQFHNKTLPQHTIVFEKSATYFDNTDAPRSAAALLPKADVIVSKLCGLFILQTVASNTSYFIFLLA